MASPSDIWISLKPAPLIDDDNRASTSLSKIIPRIALERGSFADLTEAGLLQEIQEAQNVAATATDAAADSQLATASSPMQVDNDNQDVTVQQQQQQQQHKVETSQAQDVQSFTEFEENFASTRTELTRLISKAQNEAAIALDFVSLLISCVRPAAGTTSMSPHLKSHVPVGSLGADRFDPVAAQVKPSAGELADQAACIVGWKAQAISDASNRLAKAQVRLSEEVAKEKIYWQQAEQIAASGEIITKIRTPEFRILGVRYGFRDAGSEYKEEGVATLRRGANGNIVLKTEGEKRQKVLRVSIFQRRRSEVDNHEDDRNEDYDTYYDDEQQQQQFIETGKFVSKFKAGLHDAGVENEVKRARSLLFEEELFYNAVKETSILAAQGVILDFNDRVILEVNHDLQVILDMVTVTDDDQDYEQLMQVDQDHDDGLNNQVIAEAVSAALHLQLCKLHKENLKQRRAIPKPLGSRLNLEKPKSVILEPLLNALQEDNIRQGLANFLQSLIKEVS
ncbi:mediator complex, subunit Med17 [Lipomyces japonicus]|uniref:mediator complex, subunit Med17 n=1 Tax=Lipomyces japonicus TaxID=56871 RepID=UPI0034CF1260